MCSETIGIYLHIPFCLQKCRYCDFCSYPGRDAAEKEAFTEALCREIRHVAPLYRDRTVDTLFFGGGTPTLLSSDELRRICACLRDCFSILPDAEWTCEANPATLDDTRCHALRTNGVNRLSIGMQSASDAELACLGRVHRASDLPPAVALARKHGFTNINLDLMMGIPCQTLASFSDSLDAALSLAPAHLSVYSLQIEPGTPFFAQKDALPLPDEDTEEEMYALLLARLHAKGFRHYEISNFAKEPALCRHNLRYWLRKDYLGFGPAAHGCVGNRRFYHSADLSSYIRDPVASRREDPPLLPGEIEYETILLALRTDRGIDEIAFSEAFGHGFRSCYAAALAPFRDAGLLCCSERYTALTERGMRLSNTVLAGIFASDAAAHLFPAKIY